MTGPQRKDDSAGEVIGALLILAMMALIGAIGYMHATLPTHGP